MFTIKVKVRVTDEGDVVLEPEGDLNKERLGLDKIQFHQNLPEKLVEISICKKSGQYCLPDVLVSVFENLNNKYSQTFKIIRNDGRRSHFFTTEGYDISEAECRQVLIDFVIILQSNSMLKLNDEVSEDLKTKLKISDKPEHTASDVTTKLSSSTETLFSGSKKLTSHHKGVRHKQSARIP